VRFFERKPDFSESGNPGSLNENQEYMELKNPDLVELSAKNLDV
jgi:hypothetical protein